ncbi:MAG: DMT family transporter [Boseongicola sp.]|nr:DMT family transporter [Boseongicola sp.]NNJ69078.1 DMT family transporter [Boseongicola sp.]
MVNRSNLKGVAFALTGFAVFSTHDVVIKVLGGSYAPFQILFFSALLGFPLATLMLITDKTPGTLRPVHPWWVMARTAAALVTGVSAFYAFSVLPLAQVYAFIFAAPMFITILSIPMLGEKVGVHRWAAVAMGLVGVLIVLRPGAEPLTLGHAAGITAAAGSAFASVIARKIGAEERSAVMMLYPMMANVAFMGMILPFVYVPMPIEHLGLLAIVAVFGFTGALCTILAYRSGDAAIVAPMQYSQIIWAAIFGALFFNEYPDRFTWIGAGIIVLAGVYVVVRESMGGKSDNTPVLRTRSRAETGTTPRISAMLRARSDRVLPGYEALQSRKETDQPDP